MIVKIGIEVSLDEVEEYRREFFECNGVELPFEVAKKNYVERFLASKNDYVNTDNIYVYFVQKIGRLLNDQIRCNNYFS